MNQESRLIDVSADLQDMVDSTQTTIRIPDTLRQAMLEHCAKHGLTMSQLLLQAVAREIGRLDLLTEIRPAHRPPKNE